MSLVTVYITNYNYEKYIEKAIKSVLDQTFQDFEIIIIDDGSTDNSKEIILAYEKHPKIKVILQKNRGLNVTNNIALRVAQGRYIMRLDADDYLDSNALLVMVNILDNNPGSGMVFPDYYLVDEEDNILSVIKRHSFEKDVSLFDQPAHGACTMIRRKILQKLGGYDEQYSCQDGYELWIKFITKYKPANTDTPLFYYRQHGSNLTSNEEKILNTRSKIKYNFVKKNINKKPKVLAIIPVRGEKYNAKNIPFIKINGQNIIDIKIKETLKSNYISKIIISSPDEDIESHIKSFYKNYPKIFFKERDKKFARLNTGLVATVNDILEDEYIQKEDFNIIVILSIEYPFIKNKMIDEAIDTMQIFDTESVISVRPENNVLFQHDGSGMKPILNQDKFSKLEREGLYKYTGGVIVSKVENFLKTQELISGKVGHIVIEQKSAHTIKTKLDIEIANFLALT